MDIVVTVAQILLGLAFIAAGFNHATRRDQATGPMAWMLDVPKPLMTTIGILEILGGIGVILPWATNILPWLTPVAAIALAVLMVFAAVFHARRPGEARGIVFNVILGALALFVAWGRIELISG